MIRSLRKKHLQTWIALAVLLPVGLICAWISVPKQARDKLLQPAATTALPIILKRVAQNDSYEINLRANADTSALQLEWINKKTLTYPTATIYATSRGEKNIQNALLIGRIEARGNYYFELDSSFQHTNVSTHQLLLYDFIHQEIIDTITF